MAGNPGFAMEIGAGAHLNQADVATTISRRWIDQDGVDVVAGVPSSSAALDVSEVARERRRVFLNSGAQRHRIANIWTGQFSPHVMAGGGRAGPVRCRRRPADARSPRHMLQWDVPGLDVLRPPHPAHADEPAWSLERWTSASRARQRRRFALRTRGARSDGLAPKRTSMRQPFLMRRRS